MCHPVGSKYGHFDDFVDFTKIGAMEKRDFRTGGGRRVPYFLSRP